LELHAFSRVSYYLYNRIVKLPEVPQRSFFLWGPRQVGKTSILQSMYPDAPQINLLKSEEFASYQAEPQLLRERILQNKWKFLVIDEIQKVPQLLDEVHYMIEKHKIVFALCGSSARKVRASHANLLGGRALRFEMFGLVSSELGADFDLKKLLNRGYLPAIYQADEYLQLQRSYCADYLKEEIFAEGLVRKLPIFSRFLEIAALGDTEILSYETIARDCGVSAPTVKSHYQILCDTLMGSYLAPYALRPKRRQVLSPKFYFSDVGIVNCLAQRGVLVPKAELFGKAFENWVHHELSAWLEYRQRAEQLTYWRLSTGVEVDFIVGHMACAIEAKSSAKIHKDHLVGLREVKVDYPNVKRRIVVSLETVSRLTEDGIEILNVRDFIEQLWSDQLI
jgi:predicted AAA+ superfamily ATPase